jgi:hypothetical protein
MTKAEILLSFCETFPTSVAAICSVLKVDEVMEAVDELRAMAGIPKPVLPPTPGMGARDPNKLP